MTTFAFALPRSFFLRYTCLSAPSVSLNLSRPLSPSVCSYFPAANISSFPSVWQGRGSNSSHGTHFTFICPSPAHPPHLAPSGRFLFQIYSGKQVISGQEKESLNVSVMFQSTLIRVALSKRWIKGTVAPVWSRLKVVNINTVESGEVLQVVYRFFCKLFQFII